MEKTTVVNCKRRPATVYVGRRRNGFHYGNPWTHSNDDSLAEFRVKTREEAVENYRKWLEGTDFEDVQPQRRSAILQALPRLKGQVLGCYCKPLSCHGDILAEMADRS